jgi:carbamate kinase
VGRDGAGAWRRLATSPRPLAIVEFPVVRRLLEADAIVIAAGGGGPPVYDDPLLGLEGVDAVVDKYRVAAILARQLEAEVLMILTNVDAVYHGWGSPASRPIRRMTPAQADELIAGGDLDAGGMKPKVEAAAEFVREGGSRAIIARLSDGPAALRGETGTTITREP